MPKGAEGQAHVFKFGCHTRVVKAPFFKANLKAVSKRLIKAVKRLLYVVNMMNDCFKMHYTSVHLVVSNRHHNKTIALCGYRE